MGIENLPEFGGLPSTQHFKEGREGDPFRGVQKQAEKRGNSDRSGGGSQDDGKQQKGKPRQEEPPEIREEDVEQGLALSREQREALEAFKATTSSSKESEEVVQATSDEVEKASFVDSYHRLEEAINRGVEEFNEDQRRHPGVDIGMPRLNDEARDALVEVVSHLPGVHVDSEVEESLRNVRNSYGYGAEFYRSENGSIQVQVDTRRGKISFLRNSGNQGSLLTLEIDKETGEITAGEVQEYKLSGDARVFRGSANFDKEGNVTFGQGSLGDLQGRANVSEALGKITDHNDLSQEVLPYQLIGQEPTVNLFTAEVPDEQPLSVESPGVQQEQITEENRDRTAERIRQLQLLPNRTQIQEDELVELRKEFTEDLGGEAFWETPPSVPAGPETPPTAVPAFISKARTQELQDLGWTREDIAGMTPEQAQEIVSAQRTKTSSAARESQPQGGPADHSATETPKQTEVSEAITYLQEELGGNEALRARFANVTEVSDAVFKDLKRQGWSEKDIAQMDPWIAVAVRNSRRTKAATEAAVKAQGSGRASPPNEVPRPPLSRPPEAAALAPGEETEKGRSGGIQIESQQPTSGQEALDGKEDFGSWFKGFLREAEENPFIYGGKTEATFRLLNEADRELFKNYAQLYAELRSKEGGDLSEDTILQSIRALRNFRGNISDAVTLNITLDGIKGHLNNYLKRGEAAAKVGYTEEQWQKLTKKERGERIKLANKLPRRFDEDIDEITELQKRVWSNIKGEKAKGKWLVWRRSSENSREADALRRNFSYRYKIGEAEARLGEEGKANLREVLKSRLEARQAEIETQAQVRTSAPAENLTPEEDEFTAKTAEIMKTLGLEGKDEAALLGQAENMIKQFGLDKKGLGLEHFKAVAEKWGGRLPKALLIMLLIMAYCAATGVIGAATAK